MVHSSLGSRGGVCHAITVTHGELSSGTCVWSLGSSTCHLITTDSWVHRFITVFSYCSDTLWLLGNINYAKFLLHVDEANSSGFAYLLLKSQLFFLDISIHWFPRFPEFFFFMSTLMTLFPHVLLNSYMEQWFEIPNIFLHHLYSKVNYLLSNGTRPLATILMSQFLNLKPQGSYHSSVVLNWGVKTMLNANNKC